MPKNIQSPEKELRFTRVRQAILFLWIAAICIAVSITLVVAAFFRDFRFQMSHLWILLPLIFAWVSIRLAIHLTKHAYLILTPLGLEIFPFFRPESSMRLVLWQEIQDAEINGEKTCLTLHHDLEKTSGIHISLSPIQKKQRELLAKAIIARVSRA